MMQQLHLTNTPPALSSAQDSGSYFLHLLWNIHALPGYRRDALLAEPAVYEAASLLIDTWTTELQHEQASRYRYSELPRAGMGTATGYTGVLCLSGAG